MQNNTKKIANDKKLINTKNKKVINAKFKFKTKRYLLI